MITGFKRLTLAAAVGLALAGCATVGNDFTAPKNIDATAFRHAVPDNQGAARLPKDWWTVFNDATLSRLEQSALQDNPSVRAAGQRLLQAQAQLGLTRAQQSPTLSVSTSYENDRSSANTPEGKAFGGQSIKGNMVQAGASLSYEVDLMGRVRRMVEAADAQALEAETDRDGVLLMLSEQVATAYWQLRGADADIAILKGALATREETQQLTQARFDAGLTNELDVARAKVERGNALSDLHDAQRQRNQYEHSLATLIGASPSTTLLAASANPLVLPEPPAIPAGLPASLLSQRPDLAGSVAGLRAANAQIGVAEGAFYPSLMLTGSYGYASETLRDLAKGGSRQFSAGPLSLSLPIFDGGRNRSNLALAKARYEEALANHETTLLTALREVEDALSDVQERQLQGQAEAESQQAAARAYLVARTRYERGISNYLDVTDAQRSSLTADRSAAQIATQRLLAAVAVARALGAGWQPEADVSALVAQAHAKAAH
jgi:multidrug efflux system outer membrane protein